MEKTKKKPIGRWILLALLLILALVLLVNRYTVRQVWCNLFSPTLPLDTSTDWDGGTSYEHLAYAADSEAQYLDLYVPDTDTPALLFVLILGLVCLGLLRALRREAESRQVVTPVTLKIKLSW